MEQNSTYNPQKLAVYIHWPFCKSKCPYCDFYKELARGADEDGIIAEYINALKRYRGILPGRKVKSVFFGGGTPSLMKPASAAKIIDTVAALWSVEDNAEISMEANPNSRGKTMFADLKSAGINRLSLGVQSLDDAELRFLGRTHTAAEARLCLEEIVKTFDNCSADLIYALPHQTPDSLQRELEEICSYGLKHLSLYQLTIEEGTVFAKKGIKALNEDDAATAYNYTENFLKEKGYFKYEVSNFAQPGFESRHNLTYWQGGDYIGIGKSAQGRITLGGRCYAVNYPFENELLTPEERAEELVLTGLRLTSGINKAEFRKICGLDFGAFVNAENFRELKEQGLLSETATHVFATQKGFLLIDALASALCG